jgi:hypothetical protein
MNYCAVKCSANLSKAGYLSTYALDGVEGCGNAFQVRTH